MAIECSFKVPNRPGYWIYASLCVAEVARGVAGEVPGEIVGVVHVFMSVTRISLFLEILKSKVVLRIQCVGP